MLNKKTINQMRQNKLHLIVEDLIPFFDENFFQARAYIIYESLLRRGVFKWMAARRRIISLKGTLKNTIKFIACARKSIKPYRFDDYFRNKDYYLKGYQAALEDTRALLRDITHSSRWSVDPDDHQAVEWLRQFEKEGE